MHTHLPLALAATLRQRALIAALRGDFPAIRPPRYHREGDSGFQRLLARLAGGAQ